MSSFVEFCRRYNLYTVASFKCKHFPQDSVYICQRCSSQCFLLNTILLLLLLISSCIIQSKKRSYDSNRHFVPLDKCRPLQNVSMDRCFNTNRTMQVEADKEMQTHKHRYTKTWSLLAGWPPMEAKQGEALSEGRRR